MPPASEQGAPLLGEGAYPFEEEAFRKAYPAFADVTAFSAEFLACKWAEAQEQIACGPRLAPVYGRVIALLCAHLALLEVKVKGGESIGLVSSATVDKVSVSLTPPPARTQREFWLALTPYGLQLSRLLKTKAAGGFFAGGAPSERGGFRKAGGAFESDPVSS